MQLLSLTSILILLLYLLVSQLVSLDLEYTGLLRVGLLERQLSSKLNSNLSGAEITSNFSTYK